MIELMETILSFPTQGHYGYPIRLDEFNAKKEWEWGFNIGDKEMDKNVGTSEDDDNIKARHENSVFIAIGRNPITKKITMWKVAKSDKDYALFRLKKQGGITAKILNTDNLNSARLDDIPTDKIGIFEYSLSCDDMKKYGPFKEVETIDLTKLNVNESVMRSKTHRPAIVVTIDSD